MRRPREEELFFHRRKDVFPFEQGIRLASAHLLIEGDQAPSRQFQLFILFFFYCFIIHQLFR
jgi:hypothetical protein